jgi:spore maturation protein A
VLRQALTVFLLKVTDLVLGIVHAVMMLVSTVFGAFSGHLPALSGAALDGASRAVTLSISLCGMLCLFGGVMRLFMAAGLLSRFSRLLRPLLSRLFPTAARGEGMEEIAACLSANLLGMGNAATPFALAAMEKMQKSNPDPDTATDDMVTLTVLNTAAFSLLPTTLISLRQLGGSAHAASVLLPVWLVSLLSSIAAVLLSRLLRRLFPYHKQT